MKRAIALVVLATAMGAVGGAVASGGITSVT